jgi:hypothetical protein
MKQLATVTAYSAKLAQRCGRLWRRVWKEGVLPNDLRAHARVACLPLDQEKPDHIAIRLVVGNANQRVADRLRPVAVPPQIGQKVNEMTWLADVDDHRRETLVQTKERPAAQCAGRSPPTVRR